MDFRDLFSIRSMIRAVEQWKEPSTFLLNIFFQEVSESSTRWVEVNFESENRRLAPFVLREGTGQKMTSPGYSKFIWEPPYVKPRKDITPGDLQEALITENPYSATDPGQRLIELRNKRLYELDRSITRTEEWMAMQCLFNKSIPIYDENGNEIDASIDFTRTSGIDAAVGTVWSTAATCTPLKDCRDAKRRIAQYTGLSADTVIHSTSSADELLASTEYEKFASKNQLGVINTALTEYAGQFGVSFLFSHDGMNHFRYDEWYIDPATGTETALIPAGKSLVGCSGARSVRHYGAIETVEIQGTGSVRARRWPKFYDAANLDPEVYGIQLHSAPLPATHQPDAFAVLTT